MGMMGRTTDWGATPLGPVEEWPQSLRTAAGMVLRQGIPQCLCWGPELRAIYNDGYRVILGDKHPAALGRPVLESWAEIREEIAPLFDRALAGETLYFEDLRLRVTRYGREEDAYFTFSYSPVVTESGAIGAVLVNCIETTEQVSTRSLQAERDRLLEELEVERARLGYVFQHAPSFLAVLRGRDFVFELANDAYYQLVGHRELIGRSVWEALPEARGQGFEEMLDQVMATGEPFVGRELALTIVRSPGAEPEVRYLDFVYLPLIESGGARSGVIAHGTDVTEQVLARHEIERLLSVSESARLESELANRAKSEFLAAMSHELRTPLNAIGGYVSLMAMGIHGPVTEDQREALRRVSTNQEHLLTLINEVLTYARLEAGRTEFRIQPLSACTLLLGVEALVAPLAEERGIGYGVRGCDDALMVMADDERVRQILLNLVTNAIKFTAKGGWVELSCDADEQWACLRVRDNGQGIPADKLDTIFDPFTQVGRSFNRPAAGVGLGLAISRDLARGMGGELLVESVLDEGSTFTLRLPRPA